MVRIFLLLLALAAGAAAQTFQTDVLPALQKRCAACHQGEQAQRGLRVTSAAGLREAVVPGKPDESLLIAKISGEKPAMPPVGEPLTADEIAAIRAWIEAGAPDDGAREGADARWWSLRPWREVSGGSVDAFVLARLEEKGLAPSPEADRRTLVRRLYFDVLGLPPTPEQVEAFVQDPAPDAYEALVDRLLADPAYGERWGRHWLDVVRFGESNGYEQNHLRDTAWPYRDWVIRSLNEDKPFNRMIVEQLAGDQVAPGDPAVEAATGFLVAGPHDTVGIQNPEGEAQKRANHLDDMITATASSFLGLTVHCARCHDHKFDPIQQKDYYRLQSALNGVWHGERVWDEAKAIAEYEAAAKPLRREIEGVDGSFKLLRAAAHDRVEARRDEILAGFRESVDPAGTEESFEPVEARYVRLWIESPTGGRRVADLDEIEVFTADGRNVALGAKATAKSMRIDEASPGTYAAENLTDGKFDKRWISEGGMPEWVRVELPETERIAKVAWSSDRLMGFGGRFARATPEEYRVEVSTDGESWTTVATSAGRLPFSDDARERVVLFAVFSDAERRMWTDLEARKEAAQQALKALDEPEEAFLGRFEQPAKPSFVMVRGDPMNHGDEVAPRSLSVLDGALEGFELAADAPEGERRLALARWIASDENALTARVIVNRVWQHHFGRPLVRTPSDFGVNGGEPTHPDLLEWLARRLVSEHGWRLKPLHRDILLSAAYRQASEYREEAAAVDRDAEYLWRFPPRRLSAEEVRDAMLAVSGKLDRTMGGPGFRLYRYTVDNVATYYPIEDIGPETYRRSVYHQHARSVKPELLGQFDCPDTSLPAPKRVSTTTPLQALSLLNNSFALDQARFLAERTAADAGDDPAKRVERMWRLAFGRAPDAAEFEKAQALAEAEGWEALGRAVLNANEFVYVF